MILPTACGRGYSWVRWFVFLGKEYASSGCWIGSRPIGPA
jgi:hypothetical protein